MSRESLRLVLLLALLLGHPAVGRSLELWIRAFVVQVRGGFPQLDRVEQPGAGFEALIPQAREVAAVIRREGLTTYTASPALFADALVKQRTQEYAWPARAVKDGDPNRFFKRGEAMPPGCTSKESHSTVTYAVCR